MWRWEGGGRDVIMMMNGDYMCTSMMRSNVDMESGIPEIGGHGEIFESNPLIYKIY